MRKLISVTEDDIDNGIRGDVGLCPVAIATRRQTNKGVTAYSRTIRVGYIVTRYSERTRNRILDYDPGDGMEPFKFYVEVP